MTPADLPTSAEAFGSALASADFPPRAPPGRLSDPFRSRRGTPSEISAAREFLVPALRAAMERRAVLARHLARFTHLQPGYRAPPSHTWEISGWTRDLPEGPGRTPPPLQDW